MAGGRVDPRRLILASSVLAFVAATPHAIATVTPGADDERNAIFLKAKTASDIVRSRPSEFAGSASNGQAAPQPRIRYEYRTTCDSGAYNEVTGAAVCPTDPCPEGSTQYRQWAVSADGEQPQGFVCSSTGPPATIGTAEAPPQVTDAMVLEAFRRIPVPELRSVSQPGDRTLVNFDTIFYADAEPFSRTVTLLGRSVRLDIAPESFRWEFGDGSSATTRTAGAAYPSKDVVHRYQDARTTVRHRVVATWGATWSLDAGPARPVPGTVTTTGPTTALRIAEAVPALSGQR